MITLLLECCQSPAQIVKCSCEIEAATSCNDITVVSIICGTIILVALIARWAVLSWKKVGINYEKEEQERKSSKEEKECSRKIKADCQQKLLDFLEKQIASNKEDKSACEKYENELRNIINTK